MLTELVRESLLSACTEAEHTYQLAEVQELWDDSIAKGEGTGVSVLELLFGFGMVGRMTQITRSNACSFVLRLGLALVSSLGFTRQCVHLLVC